MSAVGTGRGVGVVAGAFRAKIKCPIGCGELILVEYLENHLHFACAHRHVDCALCGKSVVRKFKEDHAMECPRLLVECPNGCTDQNRTIPREELPEHLKVCKMKSKSCKYEYLGCDFKGYGKNLAKHENNLMKHFKKMADVLTLFNLQFDVLTQNTKGDVLLLQNENYAFREGLKEILTQFERLQDANDKLTEKVIGLQASVQRLGSKDEIGEESDASMEYHDTSSGAVMRTDAGTPNESSPLPRKNVSRESRDLMEIVEQMSARLDAQDGIINNLLAGTHNNGIFLWKLKDYARLKSESISGRRMFVSSEFFFTEPYGYKMYGKAFLGGDGEGRGTHLSLFVCIARGPTDNVLPWPFRRPITFRLLDQRDVDATRKDDIKETFVPNPTLISFQKPVRSANIGSGISKFVSHAVIEDSGKYLVDDTIYVKISVKAASDDVDRRQRPIIK